ncbi:MAG TPA: Hpt domain-containing protein, partial [Polyangiaceae bacterium]
MNKDPYRYFRVEARELVDGLGAGVLELERGTGGVELVGRLLRLAHTLKGAARVVRQLEIAEAAHAIEGVLTARKQAGGAFGEDEIAELLAAVDLIGERVSALAAPAHSSLPPPEPKQAPEQAGSVARAPPQEAVQSVRVEIEEMDALLAAIGETDVQLGFLRRHAAGLQNLAGPAAALAERFGGRGQAAPAVGERERALAAELQVGIERLGRAIGAGVERVAQELRDVRQGADRL